MQKKIDTIDEQLVGIVEEIKKLTSHSKFKMLCEFTIENFDNYIEEINTCNFKGLYYFELKNNFQFETIEEWKNDFLLKWTDETYLRRFVPNPRKTRLKMLTENNEWIPLYIGKSRKVSVRIKEHLNKELEKHTFAMKLKARTNLYDQFFRVSVLEVNTKNYDLIVPILENELRNKINPIIGKQ